MDDVAARSAEHEAIKRLAEVEGELASLTQQLEHTQQLATLGTLTAGIAHEINNILTPVLAYAQLARANPHDTALGNKALQQAIAGAESASRITEAVLGFAKSDVDAHADHTDVAEVVEASLACLGRDLARDGIELDLCLQTNAEVRIRPLALQQVMLNLILNAVTAFRGTGGELRIAAVSRADGTTRITVTDTGPGLPPGLAGRLFEPFVTGQEDPQLRDGHRLGGSGLGLAVCKRLIETAGGTIAASSTPGCGATFTIIIPTYDRSEQDHGAADGPARSRMKPARSRTKQEDRPSC